MSNEINRLSVGQRLYVGIIGIFLIFAAVMIVLMQRKESSQKKTLTHSHLQVRNHAALNYHRNGMSWDDAVSALRKEDDAEDLRLTVVDSTGNVLYDSEEPDFRHMRNHKGRVEIANALAHGSGFDYDRISPTLGEKYFYSATYFTGDNIVVRCSLPYREGLSHTLSADQDYLWLTLALLLALTLILWRFLRRLSNNITRLRKFAWNADHGKPLDEEEFSKFPNDELGEIAQRIVRLYQRLIDTKEEQDVMKRQLTQNVAHELKTPVASIHGYLETMLTNNSIAAETQKQFLERCFAQANRLSSLLQDISTLNRLDDSASDRQFEPIDVVSIIRSIENETALQFQQKEMTLRLRLPQQIVVDGNRSHIYSIFRNLTDNALAYSGIGTKVEICARETQTSWFFEFSDNGIGVADSHLGRIFERFYRVDKGRSRALGGTGLGLAIVKNAVQLHGGSITASNIKGGGLLFLFSLRKSQS